MLDTFARVCCLPVFELDVCFLLLSSEFFICFWILAPYQIYDFQVLSSIEFVCRFILLMVPFAVQKLFSMMQSCLFIFIAFTFGVRFKKISAKTSVREFTACIFF